MPVQGAGRKIGEEEEFPKGLSEGGGYAKTERRSDADGDNKRDRLSFQSTKCAREIPRRASTNLEQTREKRDMGGA